PHRHHGMAVSGSPLPVVRGPVQQREYNPVPAPECDIALTTRLVEALWPGRRRCMSAHTLGSGRAVWSTFASIGAALRAKRSTRERPSGRLPSFRTLGLPGIGGNMASSTDEEKTVAQWMLDQYRRNNRLVQSSAARGIRMTFGENHVYKNRQRNWGINKGILEAFRELTPDDVVWSRSSQTWRQRRESDPPDKRMVR